VVESNKTSAADEKAFSHSLAVAKEALKLVGSFRTPPTPRVYELWYRFVEGGNLALTRELAAAVEANDVTLPLIDELYDRYFPPQVDYDLHQRANQSLSSEVRQLQEVLRRQYDIGDKFQRDVEGVTEELNSSPPSTQLLGECITTVLSSNEIVQHQISETNQRLADSQRQIAELRAELMESHRTLLSDALSGIGNRRFFESVVARALASFSQADCKSPVQQQVALMLVDLDHFKRINDEFGHATGDEVLKLIAAELRRLSPEASLARIGGDEFALIQTVESADEIACLADTIRQHFNQQSVVLKRSNVNIGQVTLSIGIALLRASDTRESFFSRADSMLYASKNGGRNRISIEPKVGR
jgi:diguanylate cyclase